MPLEKKTVRKMWWAAGLLGLVSWFFLASALNIISCSVSGAESSADIVPEKVTEVPLAPVVSPPSQEITEEAEAIPTPAATGNDSDAAGSALTSERPTFTVTATEVEEARQKLEGARKLFGGYFHPFDSIAITAEELAVAENLIDEHRQQTVDVAAREDAGLITNEDALVELQRIDGELGEKFGVLFGADRMEVFADIAPKFFREEAAPVMDQLYKKTVAQLPKQQGE